MAARTLQRCIRTRRLPSPFLGTSSSSSSSSTRRALSDAPVPLPPNPSSGGPVYHDKWRSGVSSSSLVPRMTTLSLPPDRILAYSQTYDAAQLKDVFSTWSAHQKWAEMKQLFEFWVSSQDSSGKRNKPDAGLYHQYLRANLMLGATVLELLDLVSQMHEFGISPETASYNLVLEAMCKAKETEASQKLLDRMLQTGKTSLPDEHSYNLVITLLFSEKSHIDSALKYLDLMLKSGYTLSMKMFMDCARSCINSRRLDTLTSIIEKCKGMEQNKTLSPSWNMSNFIMDIALQEDNSKLALYCLEFLARWIARGELVKPPRALSVDEGLIVSALGVSGRTYNPSLLQSSWSVLEHSLRKKKLPCPESYLGKIHALASLGNLKDAFATLKKFETAHSDSPEAEDLFSPFTSLHPLVVACCVKGFSTLDTVYFQLENLKNADTPYKSVAALNCVILGSANIWDIERAYETFESIEKTFELTPDIHSYNALMSAFGKHRKTDEASRVFQHLTSLGVKPNAMTYSLLVDAHLVNRDHKTALDVIDEMVNAGFIPSKDTLKKVRRRCSRELDFECNDKIDSLARKFNYRMGNNARQDQLFGLVYTTEYA